MHNKARFWTGIGMGLVEVLILIIIAISQIPYKTLLIVGLISAIVIYNLISGILIWNGSRDKNIKKKK